MSEAAEIADVSAIEWDTPTAVKFLQKFVDGGPWCLTAIVPDGVTETRTFEPGDELRLERWIERHQGERNVYFTVNVVDGAPEKKPSKLDIARMGALHVDVDVNGSDAATERTETLRRLRAFEPAPSIIVDSGGGFQGFWRLAEHQEVTPESLERLEAYNRGLSKALGGDHCHNIDRLMRLPGTVNLPNEKKVKAGRVPALARIVEAHWDRFYALDEFTPDSGTTGQSKGARQGKSTSGTRNETRSEKAFRLGLRMLRAGKSYEEFCEALRDNPDPELSDWYREKGITRNEHELGNIWENAAKLLSGPPWQIDPRAPYAIAQLFCKLQHNVDGLPTLHHHRGGFYAWNGKAYPEIEPADIRAELYRFLDQCVVPIQDKDTKTWEQEPVKPNTALVNNVLDGLRATAQLPATVTAPVWLDGTTEPEPGELIACANGLLHLPTRKLLPHSPAFFTQNVLDYAYDRDVPRPVAWLTFLDQLWPDDAESIATLQEIFGYCLTADTAQQKAFLLVGPKRSGKGTIARVLRCIIGADNTTAPTLAGIVERFGLQPLIGKRLAIIADARLSGRVDQAIIAERLLSITGEDALTIDRKNRDAWTGKLDVRFLILTNELPRLADASGALASRFIVLVLTESFYGREDPSLTNRLLAELPGILNWSIEGWRQLYQRGHFIQPAAAQEEIDILNDLGSPVSVFVRERCEVGPGKQVNVDRMFREWREWCDTQGRTKPGTKQSFGRDLHAAVPGLKTRRNRREDYRFFEGIGLSPLDPD